MWILLNALTLLHLQLANAGDVAGVLPAPPLESLFIARLSRCRPGDADRLRDEFERLRVLRLACRIELQAGAVPLTCYEALQAEKSWRVRTPGASTRLLRELDSRCARASEALRVPSAAARVEAASPICRKHVARARRISEYRDADRLLVREL